MQRAEATDDEEHRIQAQALAQPSAAASATS